MTGNAFDGSEVREVQPNDRIHRRRKQPNAFVESVESGTSRQRAMRKALSA